jgi:hypothetical protein
MAHRGSPGGCRALHLAFVVAGTLAGGCNAVFGIHEGMPPPPCYDPSKLGLLIDDMEDGMGDICDLGGRHGGWYTQGDGTSTMLEPAVASAFAPAAIPLGGRGQSHYAARFSGSGFTDWGALMGFELDTQNLKNDPYDASSTGGIKFWMKSDVPVAVNFLIPQTVLLTDGGLCAADSTDPNCNSHFSFKITAPSNDWTEYEVPFSALTQQYGGTATWNPQVLLGVQFLVGPGAAFDVWVDDVSFYRCTSSACKPTCNDPGFPVACAASGSHPAACLLPGTDCSAIATWCSDPLLIDDMEDDNAAICNSGGRSGNWYTVADGTEGTLSPAQGTPFTMTPIPGGRGDSLVAARMTGSGFTTYAQMALNLNRVDGVGRAYDASAHGGITFWMKTDAPNVALALPIPQTLPVSSGGLCPDSPTPNHCYNDFLFGLPNSHSNDWFQYRVPFSALFQGKSYVDANGNLTVGSDTWDPTQIIGVKFTVNQPSTFELWIDDLSFWDCSNETCAPTCPDPTAPVACPALGTTPAICWPAGTDCSTVANLLWKYVLASVAGTGPDDVWAVGANIRGPSAVTAHWDGSAWSSFPTEGAGPLWGVWEVKKDDVWAVGDFGTVVHWNGNMWSLSTTTTQASLNSVWANGVDDTDIWAAGANGVILHYDGGWSVWPSVSSKTLYRLWGTTQNDVWAVGDAGTILHFDGTIWSPKASGTNSILWGVWGSSSTDVYAVGNTASGDVTILHWDGAMWAPVSTPAAPYPNAVWGSGPDDVWVVGTSILHWNGTKWMTVTSPTTDYLYNIWGSDKNNAWIVTGNGNILRWDGQMWSVVPTTGIR